MNDEIDSLLVNSKICESVTLKLESAKQNHIASINLVQQGRYTLDIVSRELDHKIYDNEEFKAVVKDLATSGAKAKIRLLIQDSDKAVKQGHRLVELARRLTSFIDIRIQGKRFKEFNEAWLIVDSKAWVRRPFADKYNADVSFLATRQLRETSKIFNTMWDEASHDPNLRRLSL
ncbi:MAG: hypothetical protein KAT25_09955 [Sulfuriflexus sp.]|nr:hypothetical protein [Sulfuriflexus sp.]